LVPTITVTDLTGDPVVGISVTISGSDPISTNSIYATNVATSNQVLVGSSTGDGTEQIELVAGTYNVWVLSSTPTASNISNIVTRGVSNTVADADRTARRTYMRDQTAKAAYDVYYRLGVIMTVTPKGGDAVDVYGGLDPADRITTVRGGTTDLDQRTFYIPRQPNFEPTEKFGVGSLITYGDVNYLIDSYQMNAEDETWSSLFTFSCSRHTFELCED